MKRVLHMGAAALSLCLLAGAPGAPRALAQEASNDRVNQVIIFGDDVCPLSEGDTITVCARLDESERFRIPPLLRDSTSPDNVAWSRRARSLEAVGRFGPMSCTPVGAGGELGCNLQFIQAAFEERRTGSNVRFAQLIEQERADRLAKIDAEAAATQERVEELERAYMEQLESERAAPLPPEIEDDLPRLIDPGRVAEPPRPPIR